MAPDWQKLGGLSAPELTSALQAELDNMMREFSDVEEDELLAQLPAPLRVLWLLDWLDFEVSQGSLLAYFFNAHGRHAALAADALREIGATRMADVVMHAAASVNAASGEWEDRRETLDREPEYAVTRPYAGLSNADELSAMTKEYWAAADEEQWGDKLEAFLAAAVAAQARPPGGP